VVSRHYRIPAHDEPLGQGDIFLAVPVPLTLFDKRLIWDAATSSYRAVPVEGEFNRQMLFLTSIELKPAIVIDQSCDAPRAPRVILAPLYPFTPEGKQDDAQWKHISRMATSLADPTRFYLPDEPFCALGRHLAELDNKFDLPAPFVSTLIATGKRVLSLSTEALGFLQSRLGVLYSRHARDDYAWPSVADLQLKRAHLQKQIESKEGDIKGWRNKAEREETLPAEREQLQAKIAFHGPKLQETRQELDRCNDAIREQTETKQPVHQSATPAPLAVPDLPPLPAQGPVTEPRPASLGQPELIKTTPGEPPKSSVSVKEAEQPELCPSPPESTAPPASPPAP
jgi:hypothetical protein